MRSQGDLCNIDVVSDSSNLVTFAIETERIRPDIARSREIAEAFAVVARDQIPESSAYAAGFDVARTAIATMAFELDEHEQRILDGLRADADLLQLTVDRYRQSDAAVVKVANATATQLPTAVR
jgi:hypothetical protein